jgi:acyl carrier protein
LIMEFEKEFGIQIAEEDASKISTVGEAISHIEAAIK